MENIVFKEKSFSLALSIIDICDLLEKKSKNIIAIQLLKSGTSIGANIRESFYPESISDYIHKLSIARKEASECQYWLDLIIAKEIVKIEDQVLKDLTHIQKVLTILINSSKKRKKE